MPGFRHAVFGAVAALGFLVALPAQAVDITGAGASFPAPLYAKWADAYRKAKGTRVNYQSIGSSGGIRQIRGKTVDFGASDAPLTKEQLAKDGLIQFPTVFGGVVPVVNLPGLKPGELKLTGTLLAEIYIGKIKKWNDPAIAKLNPGVKLPAQDIGVVRRADGSGTTAIFTDYLSKVSAEWRSRIGTGTTVQWPVGLGGKGNEGVSAFVQRLPGSVGYVELSYARQNKLPYAQLQNAAGTFVMPDDKTIAAAAEGWGASGDFSQPTNAAGKDAWPITGATFILVHRTTDRPESVREVMRFFDWAYANGDQMALELDYVPMPDGVVTQIHEGWKAVKGPDGKALWPAN